MAFTKTGTPALVTSVTASARCGSCSEEAVCTLVAGRYLCPTCHDAGRKREDAEADGHESDKESE